ncbi:MAG: hypothetical protein ABI360_07785 [Allobranchiibius sp.]
MSYDWPVTTGLSSRGRGPRSDPPVLEQVELVVTAGQEAAYEAAFYERLPPVDHWRDIHRS